MTAHEASPDQIATLVKGHCSIENRLHLARDVTLDEDSSQIRTGNVPPRVMATLRSSAISRIRLAGHANTAQPLRHHARDATRPITLLLTC